MNEELKRTLEALDRVCEPRREYGRYDLVDEFLELVAEVEKMPSNTAGTEKGYIEIGYRETREYFQRVRRLNP